MRDEHGLTLIETLIALVVFSIGTLATFSMQISSRNINVNAINMTRAINLANHKIEELMNINYDNIIIKDDHEDVGIYTIYSEENVYNKYNVQWKVDDNFPMENTKTIIVQVAWVNGGNPISFEIIKAKM
jgi:prepilin-type N-terminal cleavage/methylation domain-containing protein